MKILPQTVELQNLYAFYEQNVNDFTLLKQVLNSKGQVIFFYDYEDQDGNEYPVYAVYHDKRVAMITEFWDAGDFYEHSEYNPVFIDGAFYSEFLLDENGSPEERIVTLDKLHKQAETEDMLRSVNDMVEREMPIDYFQHLDRLPSKVREIVETHFEDPDNQGMNYEGCQFLINQLRPYGYTFSYGLDGEPHDLREYPNFEQDQILLKVLERMGFTIECSTADPNIEIVLDDEGCNVAHFWDHIAVYEKINGVLEGYERLCIQKGENNVRKLLKSIIGIK